MAPIRPEDYEYIFDHARLKAIRDKMGLSQAKVAEMLDVPVNTLSRWENGVTSPDAKSLAAIYSIAKQQGIGAEFFKRRTQQKTKAGKTKLLLAWDFQNESLKADDLEEEWDTMLDYIDLLFPGTKAFRVFRAYTSPHQYEAKSVLQSLDFEVSEGIFDADSQLIKDTVEDCTTNPKKWIFILASDDGNYVQMLKYLKETGVEVYIWGSDECSNSLQDAVDDEHFIPWNVPFVVTSCTEVIRELNGKAVSRSQFGSMCHDALEEDEIYPDNVGFSRRNPYGSLLRWLERHEIIKVTEVGGKKDNIRIAMQGKP